MNNNRFLELLAKKKSGVITLSEKAELDRYLENNEDDAAVSHLLDDWYNVTYSFSQSCEQDTVQKILNRLNNKIDAQQKQEHKLKGRNLWIKISAIAAAFIIGFFGYLYYITSDIPVTKSPNIVSTKKGSKSSIVLPDGTKVWINADTRLSYDESTWGSARDVQLEGEAYFDVVKDIKRPFTVHTNTMDVKVTGTAFNVRAYANEKRTETTLIRGSVEVSLKKKEGKKIILTPNDKLVVPNSYVQSAPEKEKLKQPDSEAIQLLTIKANIVDSVKETQWTKNRLVFEKETFSDIIPVLERWYDVKIDLKKSALSGKTFSGTFENDSLEDVLESFKFSLGFNYAVQKNKIIIY